jgi:D-alanyl-D-alanine-carboxypeptidase/D-alanyl-D-alanine-endopeptidase
MNRTLLLRFVAAVGFATLTFPLLSSPARADDLKAKIDKAIQPFFDEKKAVGIVVGVIRGDERRIFGYGRVSQDSDRAPDGDTLFEIGSITKTFTSLLLAEMVQEGAVKLDDPVRLYLPPDVKVPSRNGKEITLANLATHTSGLPSVSWEIHFNALFNDNPYKTYRAEDLYAFLARCKLKQDIGTAWDYSNTGAGLLGHALARKAGLSYEDLLIKRICKPLGMESTRITLTKDLRGRMAAGHTMPGHPRPCWDFDVLAPAGAIKSSANDMLRYVAANLGLGKNPLQSAMNLCHQPRTKTTIPCNEQGLGWIILTVPPEPGERVIWHNGGTGGFRSYAEFAKEEKVGVVVLSNTAAADPDVAGLGILLELTTPTPTRSASTRP